MKKQKKRSNLLRKSVGVPPHINFDSFSINTRNDSYYQMDQKIRTQNHSPKFLM